MTKSQIVVSDKYAGQRLDQLLCELRPEYTRSVWQRQITTGLVVVNKQSIKPSYHMTEGDVIQITPSKAEDTEISVDIPVIYQDDNVIVINKPAGVLSHPTPAKPHAFSVATAFSDQVSDADPVRPGIVHRLDRDTSGAMILARNATTKKLLQTQFKAHTVEKTYLALVWGILEHQMARLELPIGRSTKSPALMSVEQSGRMAVTEYRLRQQFHDFSLVEIQILTGRMHQIRVHFAHLGHAVVGDPLYSRKPRPEGLERMFLHAASLQCEIASGIHKQFEAPLPTELEGFLHSL
jgi:23S rRNA pseudouridine1911/1915/1917 synthase